MMSQLHNTLVLSGDVRSGKTTALKDFLAQKTNVEGFLSPDDGAQRKLYLLSKKVFVSFETTSDDASETLSIGRFHFLRSGFESVKKLLQRPLHSFPHWWVVDEIGILEFNNKGFEPEFSAFLAGIEARQQACLIVVVREKLLSSFAHKYGIPAATLTTSTLSILQNTMGVVLCGGKSTRMGSPKALLCYHSNQPQYLWLGQLMKNLVDNVAIAHGNLTLTPHADFEFVADIADDQGPAAGVLAAFLQHPEKNLLVCGCDYPLIGISDLVRLMAESEQTMAVCYADESSAFLDPLLCFYHHSCLPLMQAWYQQGNRSLRHFLHTIPHKVLIPHDRKRVVSIDDPNAFHNLTNRLHGND